MLIALDKALENRSTDKFGRLHVRRNVICREGVSPYVGKEIPGWDDLGLDANRVYNLYRPGKEIEKAAQSSNNIQLMFKHIPVSPDAPSHMTVVGSTGTDAEYVNGELFNSLVIWDRRGIEGVETEEQQELSPGYAYLPVMESGSFEGLPFHGIMTNLSFNHIAQVEEGRQGPTVVVGDAKPEILLMALKSRKALLVQGALTTALLPLLAQDAKVDLTATLEGVTAANYKTSKVGLVAALAKATKGKLAQDANLDGIVELLDKLDDVTDGADLDEVAEATDDNGADPMAKFMDFCKGKMSEDDFGELTDLMDGGAGADEDPDAPEDGAPKPGKEGTAMDSAKIIRRVQDISSAKELVEPIVGKITVAHDSATPILNLAMDKLSLPRAGLNDAGKRVVLSMHLAAEKTRGETPARNGVSALAMDETNTAASDFDKAFPSRSKLVRA